MEKKFDIKLGDHGRWTASVAEGITVGIKMLSETDERRLQKRVFAVAVCDVKTSLGVLRCRGMKIVWSPTNEQFFLRWQQHRTGFIRDGRMEWLDVVGPLDRSARMNFEQRVVAFFEQLRQEANRGTLGTHESLDSSGSEE